MQIPRTHITPEELHSGEPLSHTPLGIRHFTLGQEVLCQQVYTRQLRKPEDIEDFTRLTLPPPNEQPFGYGVPLMGTVVTIEPYRNERVTLETAPPDGHEGPHRRVQVPLGVLAVTVNFPQGKAYVGSLFRFYYPNPEGPLANV